MYALVPHIDNGVKRETYFYNQVRKDHEVLFTGVGDFLVGGKYTFEVGGPGQKSKQIADVPDSYVVSDDIEVGCGDKIPLWLFGFLY